ncbi:hypothetical protein GGR56DRAFT_2297 [Xylariaceae sp. FL0804]|nr:hypothetical protein GGR56DRAFT_2297 [Xylariaceae sp. FL0804]
MQSSRTRLAVNAEPSHSSFTIKTRRLQVASCHCLSPLFKSSHCVSVPLDTMGLPNGVTRSGLWTMLLPVLHSIGRLDQHGKTCLFWSADRYSSSESSCAFTAIDQWNSQLPRTVPLEFESTSPDALLRLRFGRLGAGCARKPQSCRGYGVASHATRCLVAGCVSMVWCVRERVSVCEVWNRYSVDMCQHSVHSIVKCLRRGFFRQPSYYPVIHDTGIRDGISPYPVTSHPVTHPSSPRFQGLRYRTGWTE